VALTYFNKNNPEFMSLRIFTTIFFTISALEILAGTMGFREGVYITKPLKMLSIGIFYYFQRKENLDKHDRIMLVAFFFSMLGDIFLMLGKEEYFKFGLGSFLITHLCFIRVFYSQKGQTNLYTRLAIFIFGAIVFSFIKNQISSVLFVPVIIYLLAISVMAICAAERKANPESYRMVLIGAVLFMISDSLIAIDKFAFSIPYPTLLIMGTYVFAQYFIAVGFLKRNNLQN
jgi:uncharacterized membrane protein YhhN